MSDADKPRAADSEDESVLRENLRVRALSPEALDRIRRATEAEWRASVGRSVRRPWMGYAAVASVVGVLAVAAWLSLGRMPDATSGEPLAQLMRANAPGLVELRAFWREAPVGTGAELRAGQNFDARGGILLGLRGGGNLRVAAGSEFLVMSGNAVQLERGELYVDIPPGSHAAQSFVAITDAGEFSHVGTQFAIAVNDGATRLRVREGSVQWRAGGAESTVNAGTEVFIDRNDQVTRRALDASGDHWAWTESMAPEMDIEGRPLSEFLEWVARETGRRLVIADETTRGQVEVIRTHGNVHGLKPLQALKAVMASTSLHLELPAGEIRVSFPGVSKPRQ